MEFIPTTADESLPGIDAELAVWERLKGAFDATDEGVAYHQYPIVDKGGETFDHEPDIVLLHRDLGLLVIEVKGYRIDHIDRIEGHTWYLQNISQSRSTPHQQARNQALFLRRFFTSEPALSDLDGCRVPVNTFVALPNITRDEWEGRGFDGPAAPRTLLSDDLTPVALRDALAAVRTFDPLTDDELVAARDVLSCGQPISGDRTSAPRTPTRRGEHYEHVTKGLRGLDAQQQEIGMLVPPGPQQIRGIAGSGKTVLLAMKVARTHAKYPELSLAFTFHSKSLYDQLTALVERFYRRFANDDPNWDNLDIIHAWGGSQAGDGIYYNACRAAGRDHRTFYDAREAFPDRDDYFDACCEELLDEASIPTLYDGIFIDEAQDFGSNFFTLCLEALAQNQRLVWAYDEAQSLTSLSAPSPTNLFGTDENDDPVLDLRGSYPGGVQKSHVMRQAYRSPRPVLMAGHAIGMGLMAEDGPVQTITRTDGWESLGYEVDADFREVGETATIRRPDDHSPHPLHETPAAKPFVETNAFPTKGSELQWVADRIVRDVAEGLAPDQIMVIVLGYDYVDTGAMLANELESRDLDANGVWNGDGKTFAVDDAVTITGIHRAKGNEAASVYLVGLEWVQHPEYRESAVHRRNEAFVAISRSRAWCTISGTTTEEVPILDEAERVQAAVTRPDPSISFEIPDPKKLANEFEETDDIQETALTDFIGS
ncbi:DNA/RNA helicase, superfamily I [Halovivax ruber XH-70]|uniref:DNA/RNA helicase, superfamily I n=1 Tax=Halovivax ruber (strain DSM 18193 / JCM 13892 / XH-70) TaxID=797302 RepID=L0ICY5_HALRX|nr:nuclease-related domain-containing DEAD/DEAH box helicase [Halovivax ruber]AGB17410.1 DNA/RNA helicase, superfamily I [Halovivax ruber XH-70]